MPATPVPLNPAAADAPADVSPRADARTSAAGPPSAWMPDHAWHYRSEGFAEDLDEGAGHGLGRRRSLLRRLAIPTAVLAGVLALAALVTLV